VICKVKVPAARGEGDEKGVKVREGIEVYLIDCTDKKKTCLADAPDPIATAVTDARGRATFLLPANLVLGKLFGFVTEIDDPKVGVKVKVRRLSTPRDRGEMVKRASGLQPRGVVETPEVDVDPISEAAVRLIEEQGLENYGDDGIDAVREAVDAANAQSNFEDLAIGEAADAAESTAADPAVQVTLEENRQTPTPTATATPLPPICAGDCDGDGVVTIGELVTGVRIALGSFAATSARRSTPTAMER
jgi:hypothetical protein